MKRQKVGRAKWLFDQSYLAQDREGAVPAEGAEVAWLLPVKEREAGQLWGTMGWWLDSFVRSHFLGAFREPTNCPGDGRGVPPREEQVGGPPGHAHPPLRLLLHCYQELPPGGGGCQPGSERRSGSPVGL